MEDRELTTIIEKHGKWLNGNGGERAKLRGENLQGAKLQGANLERAKLQGANLERAKLQGAKLQGANLQWANLERAKLQGSNLERAKLQWANLKGANLKGAKLEGANLDFSCLPLWCGSKDMKVDKKIAMQIAAHFCVLDCDDKEYLVARSAIMPFAKQSHRAKDLGLMKEVQIGG